MTCPAYASIRLIQSKWWIMINTPSGDVARLLMSYATKEHAEQAMAVLGYLPIPAAPNDNAA